MDNFDIVFNFLSDVFNLPAEWFASPVKLIFYFFIPLVSLIALWTIFLTYQFKVFKNDVVNFGIGCVIALLNSFFIGSLTPAVVTAVGIGGSLMLSGQMTFWRALGSLALFIVTLFLYSQIGLFVAI